MASTSFVKSSSHKKVVLITGCSAGGIGDALPQSFHATGQARVFATARNPSKLAHFKPLGIETLHLDVESKESIQEFNNSGAGYNIPLVDADHDTARSISNLNVLSVLAVIQASIPLLQKSAASGRNPVVVNNSSIGSVVPVPFLGIYDASKAAVSSMTDTLRLEMSCLGINVIDLKTGTVKSNFQDNLKNSKGSKGSVLPENSLFAPAKEIIEDRMSGAHFLRDGMSADRYANSVVAAIVKDLRNPPVQLWKGESAWLVWFARRFMPFTFLDKDMRKLGRLDEVKQQMEIAYQSNTHSS